MKRTFPALAIALAIFSAPGAFAQTAPAGSMPAVKPAAKPTTKMEAKPEAKPAAMAPAAGGGAGKVWVNTPSKTYHCEGTKSYGKTKVGEYMTEAEAKSKGFRGAKGMACAK
jgi:hypothetical protein